jgi:lipopolysaccharide/colanic/teichoic acid biosynthesis glycosyltransferase
MQKSNNFTEMEIIEKKVTPEESLLHIYVEIEYPEKKAVIEDSLKEKKFQLFVKRVFDIAVSGILILLLSPILLLITLIIKLTSKGPILYSNVRVAYKGGTFKCHKFRSMVTDHSVKAEDHKIALENQAKGILHKVQNDSRITWIGKITRRTSMDELPQLFNVFLGDMSIIGPRPLVPFMLKDLPEFREIRCLVRPGITGLWQINDRENNTSAKFMIKYDMKYVEEYSLLEDFKILLKTPAAVIGGKGAY